eukprot:gene7595-9865_t
MPVEMERLSSIATETVNYPKSSSRLLQPAVSQRALLVLLVLGVLCHNVSIVRAQAEIAEHHVRVPDSWSRSGAVFNLRGIKRVQFNTHIPSIPGSKFILRLQGGLNCKKGNVGTSISPEFVAACIFSPKSAPNVAATAQNPQLNLIDANSPGLGLTISLRLGDYCQPVKRHRELEAKLLCNPHARNVPEIRAWEGTGNNICRYYFEITLSEICPSLLPDTSVSAPTITHVSGCSSEGGAPSSSVDGCHAGNVLLIYGSDFHQASNVEVHVGEVKCMSVLIKSNWILQATLPDIDIMQANVNVRLRSSGTNQHHDLYLNNAVSFVPSPARLQFQFNSFEELGVGGLNKEIGDIYRRVFQSRMLPKETVTALGIKHIKGILLYGPPGSGKTLVARTIAKLFGSDKVQLVNTPEIMQRYLGESEKRLRQYFEAPHAATDKQEVHFIIFDEIDAIFRERGRGDGSAASMAYDGVVNALLTQMDGLQEIDNVVVFGMTNRRELIDAALLRPGRFEVQVEIGLPTLSGRRAILQIHTKDMRTNNLLGKDVNLEDIAQRTTRYSGAELAGIVRSAASFAVSRVLGRTQGKLANEDMKVEMEDFNRALKELMPAYTEHRDNTQAAFFPYGYLDLSRSHQIIFDACLAALKASQSETATNWRILLRGGPGTGKMTLAIKAVLQTTPGFMKIVRAVDLMGSTETQKAQRLADVFRDAYRASNAVIILDDLERICEIIATGTGEGTYSHAVVNTLLTALTNIPTT